MGMARGELSGVKAPFESPCMGMWSDSGTEGLTLEGVIKHSALSWVEGLIDSGKRKEIRPCLSEGLNPFFALNLWVNHNA